MREAFAEGSLIRLMETTGDPAETYKIEFNVRGIESIQSQTPVLREQHIAEIRLTSDYPRLAPACRMLTPIFHPNIDTSAICVGDHWVAGEHLTDLVIRIGQMIAYQAYNIKSPLNGEAAMWADLNPESFPIDSRDLFPALPVSAQSSSFILEHESIMIVLDLRIDKTHPINPLPVAAIIRAA